MLGAYLTEPGYIARMIVEENIFFLGRTLGMFYVSLLIYGAITMAVEWKQIAMSAGRKILYTFTFPILCLPIFRSLPLPLSKGRMETHLPWKYGRRADSKQGTGAIGFPLQHMAERTDYDPKKRVYSPFCHILLPRLIILSVLSPAIRAHVAAFFF